MIKGNHKAAVVIPFYRHAISDFEAIALKQCLSVLRHHPIIVIKPHSLNLPAALAQNLLSAVIGFDDRYFDGIKGYNSLMLSADFYRAFLDYEFILIYQLDAFVFKDELNYWCSLNYDYIGAPWLKRKDYSPVKDNFYKLKYYLHTQFNFKKQGVPTMDQFYDKVGNGGFSLRRVKKFYELSTTLRAEATSYISKNIDRFNEDAFWSIAVNRRKQHLNIPDYKVGVAFAFEFHPDRALRINRGVLPFGCHAWPKYLNYWRPVFKNYGYDI
ncbi:DUF5672 family protein [Mucilaginibacter sp.]|uniref:DUF5672 family protein n=1 Tax=Mucilaginibacter sp. TaxID=1882438 RepID=UPI0035BC48FA